MSIEQNVRLLISVEKQAGQVMESQHNNGDCLVSVLVPFYNLSDCVDYCLSSLLNQTHSNYEVVCVDDGSQDDTLEKLMAFSTNEKVKVISVPNGGLSYARNIAVQHARGHFVTFVDGDDVVSPYYLDFLVRALCESEADQVIGKHRSVLVSKDGVQAIDWGSDFLFESLDRSQMVHRFLYGDPMISACGHLAKRSLYEAFPFPEGKVYEDTLSFENHILSCNSFAAVDPEIYGYVKRWDSITKAKSVSSEQIENFAMAIQALNDCVMRIVPSEHRALMFRTALEYSRLFRLTQSSTDNETTKIWQSEALAYVKAHLGELKSDKSVSRMDKIRFTIMCSFPKLYDSIFSRYESVVMNRA